MSMRLSQLCHILFLEGKTVIACGYSFITGASKMMTQSYITFQKYVINSTNTVGYWEELLSKRCLTSMVYIAPRTMWLITHRTTDLIPVSADLISQDNHGNLRMVND